MEFIRRFKQTVIKGLSGLICALKNLTYEDQC